MSQKGYNSIINFVELSKLYVAQTPPFFPSFSLSMNFELLSGTNLYYSLAFELKSI